MSARVELVQRTEERDGLRAELEAAMGDLASARGTVLDQEQAVGRLESEARGLMARAEEAERRHAELAERHGAQEAGHGAVWAALLEMMGSLEHGCCGLEGAMSAVGTEWEQVWGSACVVVLRTGFVTFVFVQASRRLMDAEAERAERTRVQGCAAAELEGVRGELAAAHEALRELEQAEARLEGEVQAAVKRADEAEGRMSEVAGHLSALHADVSCGLAAVGEKMALLDGECAALERGVRAVEAECEQVRAWGFAVWA